jgi:esterase/lipase superfamily enzyme
MVGPDRAVAARPDENVQFGNVDVISKDDMARRVSESVRSATRNELLIYVHGFSNTFTDAAATAALLATDLQFPGIVAIFSWPSAGYPSAYPGDEDEVKSSDRALLEFISTMRIRTGVEKVHLVAHSMGNRLVAEALYYANGRPEFASVILNHLVLAAPDLYTARYEQTAPSMQALARRVSLYASDNDQALRCSDTVVHGKRRAGQGGDEIVVVKGVETIDATPADPLPWLSLPCTAGHAYVTHNPAVLADLYSLVMLDAPVPRFRLQGRKTKVGNLDYWIFQSAP